MLNISLEWACARLSKYLLLELDCLSTNISCSSKIFFMADLSSFKTYFLTLQIHHKLQPCQVMHFHRYLPIQLLMKEFYIFKERLRMEPHCLIQFQCWSSVCFNLWKRVPFPLMWTLNRTDWKTQMVFYIYVCARARVPACALLLYFFPLFWGQQG